MYKKDEYTEDYINARIEEDGLKKIYNIDLDKWFVEDKKTGKRRCLYVFDDFIDKLHYIGILPSTSLTTELNKIESEETDKWLNIEQWYKHIPDWDDYSNMVELDIIYKQVCRLLEFNDLSNTILDTAKDLKANIEKYINKLATINSDLIKMFSILLYNLVKEACLSTHYILII